MAIPSYDDFKNNGSQSNAGAQRQTTPSFEEFSKSYKSNLTPEPRDAFTSTAKATGAHILNSLAGQPIEDIGQLTGSEGLQSFGQGVREYAEGVQQANPSQINTLGDIVDKPGTAIKTALGNLVPQIPLSVGGAALGAKTGAKLGSSFGARGAAIGGALGAGVGMFVPSYAQEYAEMRGKQHESGQEDMGKAALTAIPAAGLETLADASVLGRLVPTGMGSNVLKEGASRLGHVGKQAAKGFGIEAGTEYAQTGLEQYGGNEDLTTEQAADERNVSAALGGIGGGIMRGGISAFDSRQQPQGPLSRAASNAAPQAESQQPGIRPWETPSYADYKTQAEEQTQGYVPGEVGQLWETPSFSLKPSGMANNATPEQNNVADYTSAFNEQEPTANDSNINPTPTDDGMVPAARDIDATGGRDSEGDNTEIAGQPALDLPRRNTSLIDSIKAEVNKEPVTKESFTRRVLSYFDDKEPTMITGGLRDAAKYNNVAINKDDSPVDVLNKIRQAYLEQQANEQARTTPTSTGRTGNEPIGSTAQTGNDVPAITDGTEFSQSPDASKTLEAQNEEKETQEDNQIDAGAIRPAISDTRTDIEQSGRGFPGGLEPESGNGTGGLRGGLSEGERYTDGELSDSTDNALRPELTDVPAAVDNKSTEDLTGDKINRAWTKFADDSGSLNVPRAEMPQVKAEHRGALVKFLNAKGISHEKVDVSASELKPTQAEFSPSKVKKAQEYKGGNRSILISSDNHVVDGHHQWLAKMNNGEDIEAIRLNAPISQLLNDVKQFPSVEKSNGAKNNENTTSTNNAESTVTPNVNESQPAPRQFDGQLDKQTNQPNEEVNVKAPKQAKEAPTTETAAKKGGPRSTLKLFNKQVEAKLKNVKLRTPDSESNARQQVATEYEAQIKRDVADGRAFTDKQLNDIADNQLEHLLPRSELKSLNYTDGMIDDIYSQSGVSEPKSSKVADVVNNPVDKKPTTSTADATSTKKQDDTKTQRKDSNLGVKAYKLKDKNTGMFRRGMESGAQFSVLSQDLSPEEIATRAKILYPKDRKIFIDGINLGKKYSKDYADGKDLIELASNNGEINLIDQGNRKYLSEADLLERDINKNSPSFTTSQVEDGTAKERMDAYLKSVEPELNRIKELRQQTKNDTTSIHSATQVKNVNDATPRKDKVSDTVKTAHPVVVGDSQGGQGVSAQEEVKSINFKDYKESKDASNFFDHYSPDDVVRAIKQEPDWQYAPQGNAYGVNYWINKFSIDGEQYTAFTPKQNDGKETIIVHGEHYIINNQLPIATISRSSRTESILGKLKNENLGLPFETIKVLSKFTDDIAKKDGSAFGTIGAVKTFAKKLRNANDYALVRFKDGFALKKIEHIAKGYNATPILLDYRPTIEHIESKGISGKATTQAKPEESALDNADIEHNGVRIYRTRIKDTNYYAVETDENKERRLSGDRNRGGDGLLDTLDAAKKEADRQIARREEAAKRNKELAEEEKKAEEAKAKKKIDDYIDGFKDDADPKQRGVAVKYLNKPIRSEGKVTTIKELVKSKLASGEKTSTFEEDKIKPMSRMAYFRADENQQREHEKRVKEGGKKTVYLVGNSDLGKIAYDYANYLSSKPAAKPKQETKSDDVNESPKSSGKEVEQVSPKTDKKDATKFSKSTAATNTHTKESLTQSIRKAMDAKFGEGWTDRLFATDKFKVIDRNEAVKLVGANALFHKVWHGSPHDHNKFDSNKIGTGEGAQVFGYGHYFTDSEDIAKFYRDKLSPKTANINLFGSKKKITVKDFRTIDGINAVKGITKIDEAINSLNSMLAVAKINPEIYSKSDIKYATQDLELLKKINKAGGINRYGKVYEVELAPSQDEYLDWDKPISEQSALVKDAIEKLQSKSTSHHIDGDITGKDIYKFASELQAADEFGEGDKGTSGLLQSLGIRGIRYYAGSLSFGSSTDANNYVIFDDNDIEIVAKYSKDGGAQAFYNPANDTTYFVADNINKDDDLHGLALHEIGVHALQLGKNDAEFQSILKQLDVLKDKNAKVKAAYERIPKDTNPEHKLEELAAYLVQHNSELPISKRIIAWFKNALRNIAQYVKGADRAALIKWANSIDENDVIYMANAALKSAPDTLAFDNIGRNDDVIRKAQKQGYKGTNTGEAEEWLRAKAKGLDMSHEARMQRARDMGFDVDTVWYHGTSSDITAFKGFVNWFSTNPKFASEYAELRDYDSKGGGNVIPTFLKSQNAFDADKLTRGDNTVAYFVSNMAEQADDLSHEFDDKKIVTLLNTIRAAAREEESGPHYRPHDFWFNTYSNFGRKGSDAIKQLFNDLGFDSINFTEDGNPTKGVINANQIRSINAAFDPDYADSGNLLASYAQPVQRTEPTQTPFTIAPDEKTPAFKRWFRQSKMKRGGEPVKFYHGSQSEFTVFDKNRLATGTKHPTAGLGHFFTESKGEAHGYGPNVHEVFLSIQKPYVMNSWQMPMFDSAEAATKFSNDLKAKGFDGIYLKDAKYAVVFDSNQAKLTSNENPSFADDIRYSRVSDITDAVKDSESWSNVVSRFDDLNESAKNSVYALATQRQLVDIGKKALTSMTDYLKDRTSMNKTIETLMHHSDDVTKKWEQLVKHSNVPFMDTANKQANKEMQKRLADVMNLATVYGQDPRKKHSGDSATKDQYDEVFELYDGLNDNAKRVFDEAAKTHQSHLEKIIKLLKKQVDASNVSKEARDNMLKELDNNLQASKSIYFPLSRFGNYWLYYNQDGTQYFNMFETENELKAFKKMHPDIDIESEGVKLDNMDSIDGVSSDFLTNVSKLVDEISDPDEKTRIKDAMYQLYLKSLPDLSARKHFIHRKKTPGFHEDALRGFAKKTFHDAKLIGRLEYRNKLEQHIKDMRKAITAAGSTRSRKQMANELELLHLLQDDESAIPEDKVDAVNELREKYNEIEPNPTEQRKRIDAEVKSLENVLSMADKIGDDVFKYSRILNELQLSHDHMMNPSTSSAAVFFNSIGFINYLGFSPSAALVNTLQTPTVSLPYMGARYGFGKVTKELNKAFSEFVGNKNAEGEFSIETGLSGDDLTAFTEMHDRGILTRTRSMDLIGLSEEGVAHGTARRRLMYLSAFMFNRAEVMNREITGITAFRLAMQDPKLANLSKEDRINRAVDYADEVINTTHGDYTQDNRSRIMRGNVRRVIFQFKQYSQLMTYLWGKAGLDAIGVTKKKIKGEPLTSEDKEAVRLILGMVAMQGSAAGLMGLPIGGFMIAAQMLADMIDDDDDPIDVEAELKKWIYDNFTDSLNINDAIARGPLTAWTGLDFKSRLNQSDMWFRTPDRELEGNYGTNYLMETLGGPIVGIAENLLDARKMIGDGHVMRGIERMLPKAVKDPLTAIRYNEEGARNFRDDLIEDINIFEAIAKAGGFNSAALSLKYDESFIKKRIQMEYKNRYNHLMDMGARARIEGDSDAWDKAWKEIQEWNKVNPEMRITRGKIIKSAKQRKKTSKKMDSGFLSDKRLKDKTDRFDFIE